MAPRWPQDGPKTGPRGVQDGSEMCPRRPQDASQNELCCLRCVSRPRWVQDRFKRAQDLHLTPTWAQLGPFLGRPRALPTRLTRIVEHSLLLLFLLFSWPQEAPRGSKMTPSWLQEAPRWPQDGPKMGPRRAQEGSKMAPRCAQGGPKTPPRTSYVVFVAYHVQDGSKIVSRGLKTST